MKRLNCLEGPVGLDPDEDGDLVYYAEAQTEIDALKAELAAVQANHSQYFLQISFKEPQGCHGVPGHIQLPRQQQGDRQRIPVH